MSSALARYWHTVRYLRPVQIYGRLAFRWRHPSPDLAPAPPRRTVGGSWQLPASRRRAFQEDGACRFIGISHRLNDVGWDNPAVPRLWRYNLHYFDDLSCAGADGLRQSHAALIDRWIRENPAATGTGWEPYPTSLRLVNWIKWLLAGGSGDQRVADSLATQARWLERRLEWHLLGNHLWVNGKALVFAGAFFTGAEADRWLATGLRIVRRELEEQVLSDGAHFELTPMYHALFVEDLLDLVNLGAAFPAIVPSADWQRWRALIPRMLAWLRAVSHGDVLAHFNDVAQDVAPLLSQLEAYGGRLQLPLRSTLPEPEAMLAGSGLVRLEVPGAVVIADVAAVGPDYMPGHAHADTLSFEMSVAGQRLFVNGGTSTYEANAERLGQRGTRSHNTVVVDDADSSEVWASFRVARRARSFGAAFARHGCEVRLEAAHDGYKRLAGRPVHRRSWTLAPGRLAIIDEVAGAFRTAKARLLLAPGWTLQADDQGLLISGPTGPLRMSCDGGDMTIEPANYHAGFGDIQATQRVRIRFRGPRLTTTIVWPCDR